MKVLFLDIDGVVNCEDTFMMGAKGKNPFPLDPEMAFRVGKIVLYTGCEVVLSSSWRHHAPSVEAVKERVTLILDVTGTSKLVRYEDKPRGHEIQEWLDNHPEVDKYAILDDDSDMLDSQKHSFFQTSWKKGLTEDIMAAVIKHLGTE